MEMEDTMTQIPKITDSLENPHATFNKLETKVKKTPEGWRVVIRYFHTETGAEHLEMSQRRWNNEQGATQAATTIAHEMQSRIERSYGRGPGA